MKKIVSFFGEPSPVFDELNRRAEAYAAQKGFDYRWVPQKPFHQDQVIQCLREADMGLIDVEPYGEEIFREIDGKCPLLVRFGVGYDKVDGLRAEALSATELPWPGPPVPTPAAWPKWR